ncbi:MAG: C-terminal binding protein [Chloroflexi bacterium]|nr:C-terminal binding protein [Chloroflexota bacterium]MCI0774696.1 C-terminal binding protein [Chloroflexota bacterium]MCI0803553.1 C-terminal binding protein [Chloroflexota bacterium]MCI0809282.1 C-terminal binding protein [Chloroflexota bacterium]MCI0834419.1 C-terminal binding protein [Chloroflexota bacterium]
MAKHRVVVLGPDTDDPLIHERAEMADLDIEFVQEAPKSEGEAIEAVRGADAIMMRGGWGTEQVIRAAGDAQVLAVYSHGFNHIDVETATEMGIIVTNGAGMCAEEVSNQAVTMALALNRQLVQTTIHLRNVGDWERSLFQPIEPIDEQTLGIVGFGTIGRQVARKLGQGWRMETLVFDPYIEPWIIKEHGVEQVFEINELCERADYIIVVVPLNTETFHMIGEDQFDHMKKSAYYINVCRGSVTDEPALIEALRQGKIRGAGLDVFEQEPVDPGNPLLQMENVITAPHIAGMSTRSGWLARQRASQQVAAVLRGEWPSAGQNPEVTAKLEQKRRMPGSNGKISGHA